jgi:hypothetical protein
MDMSAIFPILQLNFDNADELASFIRLLKEKLESGEDLDIKPALDAIIPQLERILIQRRTRESFLRNLRR